MDAQEDSFMQNEPTSSEMKHLQNLIGEAKHNRYVDLLRHIIKSAADEAPATDVIRIAETILSCGMQNDDRKRSIRN